MNGDPISGGHTIVRYCRYETLDEDGYPTSSSFSLRPTESYLSVNCLQLTDRDETQHQLDQVRIDLQIDLALGAQASLATLIVETVVHNVLENTPDSRELSVLHEPPPDSHCGVYNMREDDIDVEDLIAECILAVYPAR